MSFTKQCIMFTLYFKLCSFQAEKAQQEACDKFEQMSDKGKEGKLIFCIFSFSFFF